MEQIPVCSLFSSLVSYYSVWFSFSHWNPVALSFVQRYFQQAIPYGMGRTWSALTGEYIKDSCIASLIPQMRQESWRTQAGPHGSCRFWSMLFSLEGSCLNTNTHFTSILLECTFRQFSAKLRRKHTAGAIADGDSIRYVPSQTTMVHHDGWDFWLEMSGWCQLNPISLTSKRGQVHQLWVGSCIMLPPVVGEEKTIWTKQVYSSNSKIRHSQQSYYPSEK